jgi:post-segregation antitoxin (ccd killing protein)
MVKSISTIYINSETLRLAKEKALPISDICEAALNSALGVEANQGTTEGALGNSLLRHAEQLKDVATLRKSYNKKMDSPLTAKIYEKILRMFQEKYGIELSAAVLIAEGRRDKF